MLKITNKIQCSGCGACVNICPNNCITMQPDEEGFAYPCVNPAFCIKCGACIKVCPIKMPPKKDSTYTAYACKHKTSEGKLKSASGGVFYALASIVLQQGGVVFGAAFDADFNVSHTCAQNEEQLKALRGSKYVQSDIGLTFRQAKEFLDKDKYVLFCATPCQIAGLKNYLKQPYSNLFCVDIICHSVPSPQVWRLFLRQNFGAAHIKAINFRDKKYGWDYSFLNFYLAGGLTSLGGTDWRDELLGRVCAAVRPLKSFLSRAYRNYYMKAFFGGLCNRPSCHACFFKGEQRASDITLGDFWGLNRVAPDIYDKDGVSFVAIHTKRGEDLLESAGLYLDYKPVALSAAVANNPSFMFSSSPHPQRQKFFAQYKTVPVNDLVKDILGEKPLIYEVLSRAARKIKNKFAK